MQGSKSGGWRVISFLALLTGIPLLIRREQCPDAPFLNAVAGDCLADNQARTAQAGEVPSPEAHDVTAVERDVAIAAEFGRDALKERVRLWRQEMQDALERDDFATAGTIIKRLERAARLRKERRNRKAKASPGHRGSPSPPPPAGGGVVTATGGLAVREGTSLRSPLVAQVPAGTRVRWNARTGRRAFLVSPVRGWVSLSSAEGGVLVEEERKNT
eukprot:Hpha_TRINITY_DN31221_c0_g1::TRINITY_DN31221_c0_g1_i1::g.2462::m.2462